MSSEGEVLSSDSLRVNGVEDLSGLPCGRHHLDLTPHRVLCIPKSPENFHNAKESQSKCWQGNEMGIAILVSGDVKPGRWASRV